MATFTCPAGSRLILEAAFTDVPGTAITHGLLVTATNSLGYPGISLTISGLDSGSGRANGVITVAGFPGGSVDVSTSDAGFALPGSGDVLGAAEADFDLAPPSRGTGVVGVSVGVPDVPEPSTAMLAALAMVAVLTKRWVALPGTQR